MWCDTMTVWWANITGDETIFDCITFPRYKDRGKDEIENWGNEADYTLYPTVLLDGERGFSGNAWYRTIALHCIYSSKCCRHVRITPGVNPPVGWESFRI